MHSFRVRGSVYHIKYTFPGLVVGWFCDFADTYQINRWREYAAATAAALLRSFWMSWMGAC